jgi:prophage antirepressor-like protein
MNELTVFNYEQQQVRTVTVDGEPWFVLKDVCDVVGIENPSYVRQRLDTDEVGSFGLPHPQNPLKTLEMVCINESGLYSVILRSDKPEAKAFRRWATHEVFPAIRKTGKFAAKRVRAPRAKPVDMIFRQRLNMARDFAKVTGVPLGIAVASAINDAEKLTGEDYTHWKLALPARRELAPVPHLNATKLGEIICLSAQVTNRRLEAAGLQTHVGKSWRITESGKRYGEEYPFERNGHSDYRILWREDAADAVRVSL